MPPVKHALLGASDAAKWLNCPASARLEEKLPDKAGNAAAEGSLAHELAELKVRKYCLEPMSKSAYTRAFNKIKKNELYQQEMDGYTDEYLEFIKDAMMRFENRPYVTVEVSLDYSDYAPEGFGTADCIMIGGDTMRVIDFKYGKGIPVPAEENPQMMLYAMGALKRYAMLYSIQNVVLAIMQPRNGGSSEWSITANELRGWGEKTVAPAAQLAFAGDGECKAGHWCDDHFCKCRSRCRAYTDQIKHAEKYAVLDPRILSDEEVGQALSAAAHVKTWFGVLETYALENVLEGKAIPGWKAVEGRSVRQFDDLDTAFKDIVSAGIDESLLYTRTPLTLAKLEKTFGKKKFAEIAGGHIIKPLGKPTLVPESDPREPYSRAAADFDGLETQNK